MSRETNTVVYSVIVPVFNSAETLGELYERLTAVMELMRESYELLFIEDGGHDSAWQLIDRISEEDSRVRGVQMMRNYGQGHATLCGLAEARGQFIMTLDDDLQNPPEELPVLIKALRSSDGVDVVMGVPQVKRHSLIRRWGSRVIDRMNSFILEKDPSLRFSGFRAMRAHVADGLMTMRIPYPAIGPMLTKVTERMINVSVKHENRREGRSGYGWSRIIRQAMSNFVGYSLLPLRLLALLGLVGLFVSIAIGIFILTRFLVGGVGVPGWTTLVLLLVALSGFNFLAFAILGEYLLRLFHLGSTTQQFLVRARTVHGDIEADSAHSTSGNPDGTSGRDAVLSARKQTRRPKAI